MMDEESILTITVFIALFALVSGRLQRGILTPPMVFTVFGLLISPYVLNVMSTLPDSGLIHTLAEITLILVLFTDAARIDLSQLRREHNIPIRLLIIGMPLTIIIGALLAAGFFTELSLWECAVLAIILAPTDAALGQAVVSSPKVPVRIRQALNVESGLNDGIALPVLLIFLSLSSVTDHSGSASYWWLFTAKQMLLYLAGICVGYVGAKLILISSKHNWVTDTFRDISILTFSFIAYFAAEKIGGNGFIAAFVAGLTLGNTAKGLCTCLYEFAETEGQLLNLTVFLFFGATMVPCSPDYATPMVLFYGLLSLTLARMLPVITSLAGSGLRWETKIFLGWFGPRGLASLLFALLVVEHSELAHRQEILMIVLTTVLMVFFCTAPVQMPVLLYTRKF
ncbi:MAG: sodium:proton antiporter [Candidatus Methanofishera endochildressiae]|uniref:Sodium:proton antiporter n=1 Tax=Candidatus Methanofishera endochildressiae TaxID=2738884 RepID=A0A7Z0SFA0_9GAMM|nr:sodium:proton antiporter [Candidatus Methanofishera endochildressiae]